MKTACFVPIKANSERVPGKNLRELNGKKLYTYICEHIKLANVFDDVYVDTNSEEFAEFAENTVNGNDLMVYHQQIFPDYDYYFQLFATAPYLQPATIKACYNKLINSEEYASCY